MSILIRGMEMPKSCDDCRIMMLEDTNCVPELYCGCPIVFKAHPQGVGHRPDYCPLVPVAPHGRLGDLDKLENGLRHMARYQHGDRQQGILGCCETIRLAPTIIPADESDMDSFIRIFEENDEEDGMDSFIQILKD